MKPTDEQVAGIEALERGENVLMDAGAGCGKSSFIKMAVASPKNKRKRATGVVFNVKNAREMQNDPNKPSNLEFSTYNACCMKALGRGFNVKVKKFEHGKWHRGKVEEILLEHEDFNPFSKHAEKGKKQDIKDNYDAAEQCIRLLKNTYIEPSFTDVLNIMNRYQISPIMDRAEFANHMIDFLKKSDNDTKNIDFEDQIRFCVLLNKCDNILQDLFFLDEAQDNTTMRNIVFEKISQNCQVVAVGDERQAVYFFAGSDSNSLNNIYTSVEGIKRYPLSINFRCDKNIIREANKFVPSLRYHEDKEEGEIVYTQMKDLSKIIKPGDVGISRYNAVIIQHCFAAIRNGQAATIQGQDFGKLLKSQVSGFKATSIEEFYSKLSSWYEKQCKYSDNNPSEAVDERFACLKYLADNSDTVEKIADTIDGIFVDKTSDDTITFSTGHKSKGLEWDRVHILESDNFMARGPQVSQEQAKQELNLMYIAITRARHYLNFCQGEKKIVL